MDIKHRHVIRVLDIFRHCHKVFVCMEFAPNGDLLGYLRKHQKLNESLAQHWFVQTCEAVHHMHVQLRIAHRDIKLGNACKLDLV